MLEPRVSPADRSQGLAVFRPFGACSHRSVWDPRLAPWGCILSPLRGFAPLVHWAPLLSISRTPRSRFDAVTLGALLLGADEASRPSMNVSAIWENCAYVFPTTDTQVDWTAGKLNELERLTCSARIARASTSVYRIRQPLGLPRGAAVVGAVGAKFVLGEGIHPGKLAR